MAGAADFLSDTNTREEPMKRPPLSYLIGTI